VNNSRAVATRSGLSAWLNVGRDPVKAWRFMRGRNGEGATNHVADRLHLQPAARGI
jgi:hypothetical protein